MCGIIFAINSDKYCLKLDDWVNDAMLASQVRGTNSAGIFQLEGTDLNWIKNSCTPTDFLMDNDVCKLVANATCANITVGHVRAATVGNIVKENAHPFVAEREDGSYIIMVHNGTLNTWRNKPQSDKFTVDSDWMAHMLATEGADAFEYFSGAFAVVWYDSAHPTSLFMARNKERPLHYIVTNKDQTIIGCSELGMLGWLSEKHGLGVDSNSKHDNAYFLEEGKIYKFDTEEVGSFSVVDYPKYNPDTSVFKGRALGYNRTYSGTDHTPWHGEPVVRLQGDPNSYDYDWDNEDSMWNYSPASNYRKYMDDDQEDVLSSVKEALRRARNGKSIEQAPVQRIDFEAPIEGGPTDIHLLGLVKLTTVEVGSTTKAEQAKAKESGVFGTVVRFTGIMYDDSMSTLLGTFDSEEHGSIINYDAEMRFITKRVSEKYMATGGELAAICGVSDGAGEALLILAPLTVDQYLFVKDYEVSMNNPSQSLVA